MPAIIQIINGIGILASRRTSTAASNKLRIQELHYGGISEKTREKMKEFADKDPMANLCRTPKPGRTPVLGKRYVREWDGVRHEVILLEDGRAEYKGRFFRSLTAVADHITGTHISGYAFFNVPRGKKQ